MRPTVNKKALLESRHMLVRGTNWIGDVIMSLPAISAVKGASPDTKITVLAKPWVADLYRLCPDVDEVILFRSPGVHDGLMGKWRLAMDLKSRGFDAALLLQNAIEAAIITSLAGIPVRAGYRTDGRGMLLTRPVKVRRGVKTVHQSRYYLEMVKACGFDCDPGEPSIQPDETSLEKSLHLLKKEGVSEEDLLVGMAPGAAYGPAKMWRPERYAAVADRLIEQFSCRVLLFGSGGDRRQAEIVEAHAERPLLNVAGKTSLAEAIALMSRCRLFISNDSGLMHVAGALGIPLVSIFGSTNPNTTSPAGKRSVVIYKHVECSPCLEKTCPKDFRCMNLISIDEVYHKAETMLREEFHCK